MLYPLTQRWMDLLHRRRYGSLLFLYRFRQTGKNFDGTFFLYITENNTKPFFEKYSIYWFLRFTKKKLLALVIIRIKTCFALTVKMDSSDFGDLRKLLFNTFLTPLFFVKREEWIQFLISSRRFCSFNRKMMILDFSFSF